MNAPPDNTAQAALDAIERALPPTYYADLPLAERVALLVEHWRRGVEIAKLYEELLARKEDAP